MRSKREYDVFVRVCGLLMVPWILLHLGEARAAAESLELDAIRSQVRRRFDKIDSLHLRLRRTTTIAVKPGVLSSWQSRADLPTHLGTDELLIAFRGAGRYFRVLELDYQPNQSARASSGSGGGTRRYVDETRVWTGSALRERTRNLQSGRWERHSPPASQARDCFPPAPYLRNVALVPSDPTASDQAHRSLQVLYRLPDLLERWPYAVAENTEQIDGAACVVLDGNMECELPADGRVARKRISDRIWLDPKLGLAIRKRESRIGGQLVRAVNTDFAEVLPGFWLPKRSRTEAFAPADAPEEYRDRPILIEEATLCLWVVNQVPHDLFEVVLTANRPGPPVSSLNLTPAFHSRTARSADWGGEVEEVWGLRGVGQRLEVRHGSELRLLVLDTPRWHFVWDPKRNYAWASPSRLGRPKDMEFAGQERAETMRYCEESVGVFACQRERLDGKEVDRITIYFPADPRYGGAEPIHDFDPKAQKSVSGSESRTRTYWFDAKTNLLIQRECGCKPPKYRVTADYPLPEQMPRELFSWKIPARAGLEVADPALGRALYSEGRQGADGK